jgi:predicted DCC family thiol-disulfide oxidoreductase YuxK
MPPPRPVSAQDLAAADLSGLGHPLIVLDGRVYTELDAFIEIARRFGGLWRLLPVLYAIPRPLRDWLYSRIARNRYRWFGRRDVCYLPTPDLAPRFLD